VGGNCSLPRMHVCYPTSLRAPYPLSGEKIAGSLVESKLAACVNIVPGLTSVYWWEGKVNKDSELLLMIKSRQALLPDLTSHVRGLHPYAECEVIATPIVGGSASYIQWILDSTVAPPQERPPSP
jgi:periplasmic divalent cation tolerance protein